MFISNVSSICHCCICHSFVFLGVIASPVNKLLKRLNKRDFTHFGHCMFSVMPTDHRVLILTDISLTEFGYVGIQMQYKMSVYASFNNFKYISLTFLPSTLSSFPCFPAFCFFTNVQK